jgi:hypothetical protein
MLAGDAPTDTAFGPLQGGERVLWQGRAGVAEYAFDRAAALPGWTLPESTEIVVTDRRVRYAHVPQRPAGGPDVEEVSGGELRWLWPQHVRVQPGRRDGRGGAATTQVQLVCGTADGAWPALVFAGGDLATVADADRLANTLRRAIAQFRLDNAGKLELSTPQARMLSRLLIGPEFSNYQGGPGQTASLPGALPVTRRPAGKPRPERAVTRRVPLPAVRPPAPDGTGAAPRRPPDEGPAGTPPRPAAPAGPPHRAPHGEPRPAPPAGPPHRAPHGEPRPAPPAGPPHPAPHGEPHPAALPGSAGAGPGEGTRVIGSRPGLADDAVRAWRAAVAERRTRQAAPDVASRAARIAARLAELVRAVDEPPAAHPSAVFLTLRAATPDAAPVRQEVDQDAADPAGDAPLPRRKAGTSWPFPQHSDGATVDLTGRAEAARRAAGRFGSAVAAGRPGSRRPRDAGTRSLGRS